MSDIQNEIIVYTHDHKCVPNGVGDYKFICPTKGEKPGFVPFMMRRMITGRCPCGQEIALKEETQ